MWSSSDSSWVSSEEESVSSEDSSEEESVSSEDSSEEESVSSEDSSEEESVSSEDSSEEESVSSEDSSEEESVSSEDSSEEENVSSEDSSEEESVSSEDSSEEENVSSEDSSEEESVSSEDSSEEDSSEDSSVVTPVPVNINPVGTTTKGLSYQYVTALAIQQTASNNVNGYFQFFEGSVTTGEPLYMGYDTTANSENTTILANFTKQLMFNGKFTFAQNCRLIPQGKLESGNWNVQFQKLDRSSFVTGDSITFPQGAVYEYDSDGDGTVDSGWYFTDTFTLVYNTSACSALTCTGNCGSTGWHMYQESAPCTYTVMSLGCYYSENYSTQLTLKFYGKNTTINLGYTKWVAPDDNTTAFLKHFKINGAPMPSTAKLQGLDLMDSLCLTGISLKAGDVVSIAEGAVFTSPTGVTMRIPYTMYMTYNGTNYTFSASDPGTACKATFFSDVHHSDHVNGIWNDIGLRKLDKILEQTQNTNFYIDFGDFVQWLNPQDDITLYKEAYDFMMQNAVNGQRHYHLMGNHEAAFLTSKKLLKDYIPYVEGVGSTYAFVENNMLFLALDANFDRVTGVDYPIGSTASKWENGVYVPGFTIPQAQIMYATALAEQMLAQNSNINGIVWVSHIAFKDIDETQRWAMVEELSQFGKPINIFEGHTHAEEFYMATKGDLSVGVYNLTSANVDFNAGDTDTQKKKYVYYNVSFKDGLVEKVEMVSGMLAEEEIA